MRAANESSLVSLQFIPPISPRSGGPPCKLEKARARRFGVNVQDASLRRQISMNCLMSETSRGMVGRGDWRRRWDNRQESLDRKGSKLNRGLEVREPRQLGPLCGIFPIGLGLE